LVARAAALIAAIATLAVLGAGTASARVDGVGFTFVPGHVVQGNTANVTVKRPSGTRCTLAVHYLGGTVQQGLKPASTAGGHAAWTWTVPETVQAGPAKATVRCGRAAAITRQIVIVGRLIEPKITVGKDGFSTRPNPGGGTRLSYGVMLHNDSATKDATGVQVQVNFVMADNHLLGTDSQRIDVIPAGSDFALGHEVGFPVGAPIVRLEVVIQVSAYTAPSTRLPTLANMHLVPQVYDPGWLGTVEGEVQNTDPTWTLQSANLSAVIFDSAGNVLGGGSGFAFQALPPGAREFVQLGLGFDAIPIDRAASVAVSSTSSWKAPGA
jgi:hypothetical protein